MTPEKSPLGKKIAHTEQYEPSLLFSISRDNARKEIGVPVKLPFFGADLWTAYELSWLNKKGKPQITIATLIVPADSPNIIESKSLKLYLCSFAQTKIDSNDTLRELLEHDLSKACGKSVQVQLTKQSDFRDIEFDKPDSLLLDDLDIETTIYKPDSSLLNTCTHKAPIEETLMSNLLKSNCPVTGQPDWGSVKIHYFGKPIDQKGLLKYIISFRQHTGFHEQCVEHIFIDIMRQCQPSKLSVYARYTRRGGLDINPFRTNFNVPLPKNKRTARQ
ncbi:NADPH-dependent 7-cyano-7-deazaguanine reductase QueF [Candidatus Pandoraea novymonadis]|uniref:NADPH-dependent 7-cyano-7-deazaguanine reductase n=1 Tax=Candidatus Pandoraea novymonadis TaxID=1808959 RepID=A0ABX5FF98_9BURK|nr:NADPH-dependent 7-cyano-7-deazaguanine reductase QueF [Candidatus Pandoraea novymonadis]PSB92336.1 NADPH-dependent 7-cyano-7-deazaguanine reductase [Candidatus Pandoraea novymonadis]